MPTTYTMQNMQILSKNMHSVQDLLTWLIFPVPTSLIAFKFKIGPKASQYNLVKVYQKKLGAILFIIPIHTAGDEMKAW